VPGAEQILSRVLPLTGDLEVLQLLSSGYDHMLPLLGALPSGIRLSTGRGVHREATAELAVTLLLALSRGLDYFLGQQVDGDWLPRTFGTLAGKRVLVVGYGAVGPAVAARLGPFGCDVVPVARTGRTTAAGRVHGIAELPELLPTVDAAVLCAPLTDETRGMFGPAVLALLKDGALLVNVARGELVDTDALAREVSCGRLRAALDVVAPEPLPPGHPIWTLPGMLVTPHVAAFTDAFTRASKDFLRWQLQRFMRGEEVENVVLTTEGGR
jgi:phosphoglycerate dehydrogenase-like enzyme